MKNENMNSNNNDNLMRDCLLIGAFVLAAVFYNYADKIKLWFYDNMIMLILIGFGVFAGLAMYLWTRFKRKEAEFFEQRAALRKMQAQTKTNNYYKRKGP